MFDFAALPPETNSTRMYLGAGSGPILAAAAAWTVLAKELTAAAQGLQSVVEALLMTFVGESAAALAERVIPYGGWLGQNAAGAELTATQLMAAASAYETAFTTTVPPLLVFANRAQVCLLMMTNIFGQNSPAIAANEAEYAEMWIQDATAMVSYQACAMEAVGATKAFTAAPQMVSEIALAQEVSAAERAVAQVALDQMADEEVNAILSRTETLQPQLGQQVQVGASMPHAVPDPSSATSASLWGGFAQHLSPVNDLCSMINNNAGMVNTSFSLVNGMGSVMKSFAPTATKAAESAVQTMGSAAVQSVSRGLLSSSPGGQVTARLGRAASIGLLRVPESWTAASQPVTPAARVLPLASMAAGAESEPASLMGGLPMAPMAPIGGGGTGSVNTTLRIQPKTFVMPRNPAGG